jgi:lipoprotein-anchoring transpeptidase ErfK/SrfK
MFLLQSQLRISSTTTTGDIKKRYRRQEVDYEGDEATGAVIINPAHRFLYHVTDYGRATRYGVGLDVKVLNGLVMP